MALQALNNLLNAIEKQPTWQTYRQLRLVLDHWSAIVGAIVAEHTQPIAIHQGVLHVATVNHLWAQNLMFERTRILDKLNGLDGLALSDIRFSTARWQSAPKSSSSLGEAMLWQEHPSFLEKVDPPTEPLSSSNHLVSKHPGLVFRQWQQTVQRRSRLLPLCPQCQCPTPDGELRRWSMCGLCAVKKR
ncbi:MAG: DUF721 domain-containing protein [Cyanobacteria bacterium]|nr:DUF721 domain-containing protein [Cyanobacteriota bacterium]MDW8200021.1 DUF721 domain-containing protein [Cyanobacteriota bacterium SKYGB_h_bin112]